MVALKKRNDVKEMMMNYGYLVIQRLKLRIS